MVSVVIPAFNEEKYLSRALDSLVRQKTDEKFEVIVVDNNSTDKTEETARKFTSKLDLKIVHETAGGRGAARAAGFAKAQGDIVLSTDADVQVPPDWIQKINIALNSGMMAVTGPCSFSDVTGTKKRFLDWFQPVFMQGYRLIFGTHVLCGFNFGIHKDVYLAANGFNPRFKDVEDVELTEKVAKLAQIKYLSQVKVLASGRRFDPGVLQGMFSYVTSYAKYFILKR